jgi:hypothetical protein
MGAMPTTPEFDLGVLTPYSAAQIAVRELLTEVQAVLGESLVAIWFDGSLALGDFDPDRSDIDLVVVDANIEPRAITSGLEAAHVRYSSAGLAWGDEIETIYVREAALDPAAIHSEITHLYVERGTGGALRSGPLDPGWLVHLRVLRDRGVSISGPMPRDIVQAVSDDALMEVASWSAKQWLAPYRDRRAPLDRLGTRVYVVLTACRLLYTFRTGQIVSKMAAARWALDNVPPGLGSHIEDAMAWRKEDAFSTSPSVDGSLALIEWVQSVLITETDRP